MAFGECAHFDVLIYFYSEGFLPFCAFQPERLRDEEIDELEQQLQSQARGPASQSVTIMQEESPVPSNCFKFQNRVFGESRRSLLLVVCVVCCPQYIIISISITENIYILYIYILCNLTIEDGRSFTNGGFTAISSFSSCVCKNNFFLNSRS